METALAKYRDITPPDCEIAQQIYDANVEGMRGIIDGITLDDGDMIDKGFRSVNEAYALRQGYLLAAQDILLALPE